MHAIQGNQASSLTEGQVSLFFSCGGVIPGFIFELRRGRPFKIRVFSATVDPYLVTVDTTGM